MRARWLRPAYLLGIATITLVLSFLTANFVGAQTLQESGSVGVEGRIPADPPTDAPIITIPTNGQSFNRLPITVAGLCKGDLLVEVFKNGVFAGSDQCADNSFSLQIDLFDGQNEIVARLYDALNQAGPDSNMVSVSFNGALPGSGPKVIITTNFAKRGAAPGDTLTWPLSISGGAGPYAISVDWGDKSTPDLISRQSPGDFSIEHIYTQSGVYNVVIKVTDRAGDSAYLQVVGIGNGPIQQTNEQAGSQAGDTKKEILWWPFLVTLLLTGVAFWLGQRHQLQTIRERLRRGERPFK